MLRKIFTHPVVFGWLVKLYTSRPSRLWKTELGDFLGHIRESGEVSMDDFVWLLPDWVQSIMYRADMVGLHPAYKYKGKYQPYLNKQLINRALNEDRL